MGIVTLTTDFGVGDYACGLLQGVIWSIAPAAKIVDITHDIPRHDILAGALTFDRAFSYFPPETIHVIVVDPGVGTLRKPIAARLDNQYFVGPDNGLITFVYDRLIEKKAPIEIVHLTQKEYWLDSVSHIFHGRDVFSPVAAHLSSGVKLQNMGILIRDPVRLNIDKPKWSGAKLRGQVIHVDHFGNMATNIRKEILPVGRKIRVAIGGQVIEHLSNAFGDVAPGALVAIIDSSGYLSVCVSNGSASKRLTLDVGAFLELNLDQ
jgi:S-adenosyl-L-methionine hydrolase (adenosine-forming)